MSTRRYRAFLSGPSWSVGPEHDFPTIREARAWAESYGTTADACHIYRQPSDYLYPVASHRRDSSGDGSRWFRATP